jgi:hypothetical protein
MMHPESSRGAVQYMLAVFLPDQRCRYLDAPRTFAKPMLRLPRPKQVSSHVPLCSGSLCRVATLTSIVSAHYQLQIQAYLAAN